MKTIWYGELAILIVCLTVGFVEPASAQADSVTTVIEFKNQEKTVRSLQLSEFDTVATENLLKIFEVHEQREREYKVYPVNPVFDHIFGEDWERAEEVVFTCRDGYQPSIPVAKFLTYDAYFASANADDSPFILNNMLQNHEIVELGPVYLIWDNLKSPLLLNEGASDMPYQITEIKLTSFAAHFPGLFPSAHTSPEVQEGFLYFRKYCIACHSINGRGGNKAPELNRPVSVTEYIKPEYLKRWISDPASIRYNTTMPALAMKIPKRDKIIENIIAYLKAMSAVEGIENTKDTRY